MRAGVEFGDVPFDLAGIETRRQLAIRVLPTQRVHVHAGHLGHLRKVGISQRARPWPARQALGGFQLFLHAQNGLGQIGKPGRRGRRVQRDHVPIRVQALRQ
ncbi:hypothetical protein D3C71_1270840 [compost metagenome]